MIGRGSLRVKSKVSVGESFELEPVSTTQRFVHVVRNKSSGEPLGDGLPWPYHRLYIDRFYRYETVTRYIVKHDSMK